MEDGRVILSGEVSSLDAFETAIAVAEVFSGRTVVPDLAIRPSRSTLLIVPRVRHAAHEYEPPMKGEPMKKLAILAAVASVAAAPATFAERHHKANGHTAQKVFSEPGQRVGQLNCEIQGGVGLIVGSLRRWTAPSASSPAR